MKFFGRKKQPGEMTDDEMGARLRELTDSLDHINLTIGCVAGAVACVGIVAGILAMPLIAGIGIPLAIMGGGGIGGGAIALAIGSAIRDGRESEVFALSEENKERIFQADLKKKIADGQAQEKEMQSALKLRQAFDKALADIAEGRGIDKDLVVKRPLQLKTPRA